MSMGYCGGTEAQSSRFNGERFVERADEKLTAFLELEFNCSNRLVGYALF